MQIFLFSHDPDEADILSIVLQHAGFTYDRFTDLTRAIDHWFEHPAELIILAIGDLKPQLYAKIKLLRGNTINPLIIITDPLSEDEHVNLLKSGVDIVIFRPFSSRLLIYQMQALLRRSESMPLIGLPQLSHAGVILDPATRCVTIVGNESKHLTQLEFRLLYTLMTHADQIIPSEILVERVWGYSGEGNRELVRGLIQRLRNKVETDPHTPHYIITESGIGYIFRTTAEE